MVKRESIRSPFKRQTVDNYRRKLQYLVFGNRRCPRNRLLALVPYFPELECFAGVLKHGENKVGRVEVFWWRSLCSQKRNFKQQRGTGISVVHRFYSAYWFSWTVACRIQGMGEILF